MALSGGSRSAAKAGLARREAARGTRKVRGNLIVHSSMLWTAGRRSEHSGGVGVGHADNQAGGRAFGIVMILSPSELSRQHEFAGIQQRSQGFSFRPGCAMIKRGLACGPNNPADVGLDDE